MFENAPTNLKIPALGIIDCWKPGRGAQESSNLWQIVATDWPGVLLLLGRQHPGSLETLMLGARND